MVITSAFQADFVGSSPITRRKKNVFRGVLKHDTEEMAFDTAISLNEVCRAATLTPQKGKGNEREEVQDSIHAKAYEKRAEKARHLGN
jgi:hypothetical protein